MKTPHFFKAYSRLGLLHKPHGIDELNTGVEEGPDAVITPEFASSFRESETSSFRFSLPDLLTSTEYPEIIVKESLQFAKKIKERLKSQEIQVIVGGDHSVTYAGLLALSYKLNLSDIEYIQIDSHGDMNSFGTSPTGNFHGIYLRPFIGEFDNPIIQSPVTSKLNPTSMTFIGNLDLDPGEKRLFFEKGIRNIRKNDIDSNQLSLVEKLKETISAKKHLHVSVDIDGFDKLIAPATGIPAQQGLMWEDTKPFFEVFAQHPSLSIDLVEVNPRKEGVNQTVSLAQKILKTLLKH